MLSKFNFVAAAAVAAVVASGASAATFTQDLTANNPWSFSYTVPVGEDGVTFSFNVLEDSSIPEFSLSGSGTNAGDDISSTTFEITDPATGPSMFGTIQAGTSAGAGLSIVPGGSYSMGDMFSVIFRENAIKPISYTLSFDTSSAPSPIPVPAAGGLLLAALGGFAALKRRKKKAA